MEVLVALVLSILLIAVFMAAFLGLWLGLGFLAWELYRHVIPYFFGGLVPNVHSPWYNLVHPHFWPFAGLVLLLAILVSVLKGIVRVSCKTDDND